MWEKSSQFWAARNAFRSSTIARQQGRSTSVVTPSGRFVIPSLEAQERKWTMNAERYLGLKHASVLKMSTITVRDGSSAVVRKLLARLVPALTETFDAELGQVAIDALYGWPVASGYSKSSITLGYDQDGEYRLIGRISNSAPYTVFIKGSPWNKLVRAPTKAAASRIAATTRLLAGT
jgi:hypothetical protein